MPTTFSNDRPGIPRRDFLRAMAAAALLTPTLAACGTSGSGSGPISVGVMTPLAGGGSPYGPNILKAFQVTASDINAAGEPHGQHIKLHTVDSQTEAGRRFVEHE